MKKHIVKGAVLGIILLAGILTRAEAATLLISPSVGSYISGNAFSVYVTVNSGNQIINAVQGTLTFPQDKLEVTSVSKSGSIITLWAQEPVYSNLNGTVQFEGIVPNPGYIGISGRVIQVNFRAKAVGEAPIGIVNGSVLANDGQGTQILSGVGNAIFAISTRTTSPGAGESSTMSALAGAPQAPRIISSTHSNRDGWYSNNSPHFSWELSRDIVSARLLYDKHPSSAPTVLYSPAISERKLENIGDGVWYFHLQLRNENGWGSISHFRFQIDTAPPAPFSVSFVKNKESPDPRPLVKFESSDELSGISHYRMKIGDGDFFTVEAGAGGKNYQLPLQDPGKRTLVVQAVDKAGNQTTASEEFTILPLESPVLLEYPQELEEGEILIVKGKTIPGAMVNFFVEEKKSEARSHAVRADDAGLFTIVWPTYLESGLYKMWAEAVDKNGARSEKSEIISLAVQGSGFKRFGSIVIGYLSTIAAIVGLCVIIALLTVYGWRRYARLKKDVRRDLKNTQQTVHKAFVFLFREIQENIKSLEHARSRRQLSEAEEAVVQKLKKDIEAAERIIRKEIEETEDDIR